MSVPADLSRLRVEGRSPTRVRSCSASSSETAAERLTDDLLLEILLRVPAKSLCRCRCVSKHWRSLIDHHDLRKKLPRTLAGFFYSTTSTNSVPEPFRQPPVLLASVPGSPYPLISTSLAFLPNHQQLDVLDCCNGLLLCHCHGVSTQIGEWCYVVCNPATEKWVAFPKSGHGYQQGIVVLITRLGFDPAQSSHFHVFEVFDDLFLGPGHPGVTVYSSETGGWVHKNFNQPFTFPYRYRQSVETVFLNSRLYFHVIGLDSCNGLAAVDTEAETWTNFGVPGDGRVNGFIQCSQGVMHYANFYVDEDTDEFLAVYVLKNYESKEWILKHMADVSYIFGEIDDTFKWDFEWVGIHPECNLIFFTRGRDGDTTLMCYEMDFERVKVICNLKDGKLPYLPYVPLYTELQALHM